MMKNDIIEEVWRNRDEFAKRHNYNLDDMVAELQKSEENPFSRLVDRRKLAPNQTLERDWAKPCHFLKGSI